MIKTPKPPKATVYQYYVRIKVKNAYNVVFSTRHVNLAKLMARDIAEQSGNVAEVYTKDNKRRIVLIGAFPPPFVANLAPHLQEWHIKPRV